MPQGLQIFDASGNVLLDTSTSIGRQTGSGDIGDSPYSGTITVPGTSTGTNIWWVATADTGLGDPPTDIDAIISTSSTQISWAAQGSRKIIYGVY